MKRYSQQDLEPETCFNNSLSLYVDKVEKLEELRNLSTKHIYQDQEDLTGVLKNLAFCKTDKNKFKIVGNIYRPPGNIVKDSADKIAEILSKIKNDLCTADEIQIMGVLKICLYFLINLS